MAKTRDARSRRQGEQDGGVPKKRWRGKKRKGEQDARSGCLSPLGTSRPSSALRPAALHLRYYRLTRRSFAVALECPRSLSLTRRSLAIARSLGLTTTICTLPHAHVVVASSSVDHPSRVKPESGKSVPLRMALLGIPDDDSEDILLE